MSDLTISEIQSNEVMRHEEFPASKSGVYLAHAGVCPLPKRVVESVKDYASACLNTDQEDCFEPAMMMESRSISAELSGVTSDEIALVGPTSNALSMIASGIEFQAGQNVVIYFDDYPSNVYPWMALAEKGVEVRHLKVSSLGVIKPEHVEAAIDDKTRLVAIASCHFLSGYRINVDAIGQMLREKDILFSLDMIQTFGAFDTPLQWVDFAAADSHKWMLGPCAAGIMYVRKEIQPDFNPPVHGWHNVKCPDFVAQPELTFRNDARKFEAGSPNFLGLAGLHASLKLIKDIGLSEIEKDLSDKRQMMESRLADRGLDVLNPNTPPKASGGMISFSGPDLDLPQIHRQLAKDNITVSLRRARSQKQFLRLSPHYYNNAQDLDRFFAALDALT